MGSEVAALVEQIDAALRQAARPERAEGERRYLKSDLTHWGAGVPATRAAVLAALPRRSRPDHDLVVGVAEALWAEPVHECRLAASMVLAIHVAALDGHDLPLLERLLREARTWALVAEWLLPRATTASGVAIREAVKPLSPAQRTAIAAAREPSHSLSRSPRERSRTSFPEVPRTNEPSFVR